MNGKNINEKYADHKVVIAETPEDLQRMLYEITESYKVYGMEMNAKEKKHAYRNR